MSEANSAGTATETVSKAEFDALREKHTLTGGRLTDYEKQLESYKKYGDPESVSARLAELELLKKEKAGGNKEEWEKLFTTKESEIRSESQKAIDAALAQAKEAKGKLRELTLVDKVFGLAANKFNDDTHSDIKNYIRQYCDINEQGEILVKDDKGEIRYREGKPSEKMDANDFVNWLANQKPSWAKPTTKSGQGLGNNLSTNGNHSQITAEQFANMTEAQQDALPASVRGELSMKILQSGVLGRR